MASINTRRVILGGLAAGLAYNVINWFAHGVVLRALTDETVADLNMAPPSPVQMLQLWLIWTGYGLTLAWVVAAIRPRFGPGLGTPLFAALAVWIAGIVVPALPNAVWGFASMPMILVDALVGLVGLVIGGVLAAYLYKEA